MDIFEKLSLAGLVPVIKVEDANDAVPLCRALSEGGLPVAEITFRTAAAEQAIRNVSSALPELLGMCDRIYVMKDGTIARCFDRSEATQEKILSVALETTRDGKEAVQ